VRLHAMWAGMWPRPGWSSHSRSRRAGCGHAGVWPPVHPTGQGTKSAPPLSVRRKAWERDAAARYGLAGGVLHGGSGGWSARRLRYFLELLGSVGARTA
jgi:hypothetical protein